MILAGTFASILLLSYSAPQKSDRSFCNPSRPCPSGYGVCIKCDEGGAPEWVWSDAMGSAHTIWPITSSPDCTHFTFDERGNPTSLLPGGFETHLRWVYDKQGRVIRRSIDYPKMCEQGDYGDLSACGPPDGKEDIVFTITWNTDGPTTTASITASTNPSYKWFFAWDEKKRMTVRRNHHGLRRFEYLDGHKPVREKNGRYSVTWYYDDAGRPVERQEVLEGKPTRKRTWAYDDHGHLTEMLFWSGNDKKPDRHVWAWELDKRSFPVQLVFTTDRGHRRVYQRRFNQAGFLVGRTLIDGTMLSIERDRAGRLLKTDHTDFRCLGHLWERLTSD